MHLLRVEGGELVDLGEATLSARSLETSCKDHGIFRHQRIALGARGLCVLRADGQAFCSRADAFENDSEIYATHETHEFPLKQGFLEAQKSIPRPIWVDKRFRELVADGQYARGWDAPFRDHPVATICGLDENGIAWCWQESVETSGLDGLHNPSVELTGPFATQASEPLVTLAVTSGTLCGLSRYGKLYCRDKVSTSQTSAENPVLAYLERLRFRKLTAKDGEICGLAIDGQVYCWLSYLWRDAGNEPTQSPTERHFRHPIKGFPPLIDIAAGNRFLCGVEKGGQRLWCKGDNRFVAYRELGGERPTDADTAEVIEVSLGPSERFTRVEAGAEHACGLTNASRVFCWGLTRSRVWHSSDKRRIAASRLGHTEKAWVVRKPREVYRPGLWSNVIVDLALGDDLTCLRLSFDEGARTHARCFGSRRGVSSLASGEFDRFRLRNREAQDPTPYATEMSPGVYTCRWRGLQLSRALGSPKASKRSQLREDYVLSLQVNLEFDEGARQGVTVSPPAPLRGRTDSRQRNANFASTLFTYTEMPFSESESAYPRTFDVQVAFEKDGDSERPLPPMMSPFCTIPSAVVEWDFERSNVEASLGDPDGYARDGEQVWNELEPHFD